MDQETTFSRIQLGRLSGAPEDAIVFWLRNDLIRSVETEARKHRRFDQTEVKIAAFLRVARSNGMNLSAMRALVDKLRSAVDLYQSFDMLLEHITDARDIREGAETLESIEAKYSGWVGLAEWQLDQGLISQESYDRRKAHRFADLSVSENMALVRRAIDEFPLSRVDEWGLGEQFLEGNGIMMAWLDDDGHWQARYGSSIDYGLPAPAVIMFDWERITAIDWSQAGKP